MLPSTGPLRLRLSLLVRTLVALSIVGTFTVAVAAVVSFFGAMLMAIVLSYLTRGVELLATAPRLSVIVPISASVLTLVSFAGLIGLPVWWLGFSSRTNKPFRSQFPRLAAVVIALWFGCLYVALVEGSVVLTRVVSSAIGATLVGVAFALVVGAITAVWATIGAAHREVGRLREQLLADSDLAAESHPALVETTNRLALQADVPSPTLRISDSERPESFTLGTGADAVIVVSTGLLAVLSESEVTAVVAHEVSHLANADSRIMDTVLVPVLMADDLIDDNPRDPGDEFWNLWLRLLKRYGQFGVAILSRGREWSADAGAAALTGSPATLASALATLSETRQTPATDLREWEQSTTALDILPPADREQATGPFRTHPSTAARIERLQRQVADAERQ